MPSTDATTLADVIAAWHRGDLDSGAQLANLLFHLGPVLSGHTIYSGGSGEGTSAGFFGEGPILCDPVRAVREFATVVEYGFENIYYDRIPPEDELSKLWGIPRACDVKASDWSKAYKTKDVA